MKEFIKFNDLAKKEYTESEPELNAVDLCEQLEDRLTDRGSEYLSDIVTEIADSGVDIYNSALYEKSPYLSDYISQSIDEFGVPKNDSSIFERLIMQGEFYYNELVLYENSENAVYNAMVDMLQDEVLMIEADQDTIDLITERIPDLLEEYAEEVSQDGGLIDDIYESFWDKIQEEIDDIGKSEDIEIKKYTDNEDDEDFYIRALKFEPNKAGKEVLISRADELTDLQSNVGGLIEPLEIMNPYTQKKSVLIVDEEGKLKGSEYNFKLYGKYFNGDYADNTVIDEIVGTALIVADDKNGDFTSLSADDIRFWKNEIDERDKVSFIGSALLSADDERSFTIGDNEDTTNIDMDKSRNNDEFEL